MIYKTAQDWHDAPAKRIMFFGMSGLGKTYISEMLRASGAWFHYSADYRIGTRYLGEHIVDNFKMHAMRDPFLAELLRSDSIYIGSNISFNNLAPLSTYLGKPGDPEKGGVAFEEYQRRQAMHETAEIAAMLDTGHFIDRAKAIYGYDNFVCDSGGSLCEVVDPANPDDAVLRHLHEHVLMIWIEGSDAQTEALIERFNKAPKPMCYRAEFLQECWDRYLRENAIAPTKVDPDSFIRFTFRQAMEARKPRYAAMAHNWGITVSAQDISDLKSPADLDLLIADTLGKT